MEGSLLTHRNARFQVAPARLARYISGSQINQRDKVRVWQDDARHDHRAVSPPGVLTISGAGLIGHTRRNGAAHRSRQAVVNIVDSAGRPLFFPFKKSWNIRSSLEHLDLLFAKSGEGRSEKVALLGSSQVSFYHFVTEVAGDWWFLQQMGYREGDFSAFIVHGHRTDWQEEVLDMLRIPKAKRRYHFEAKEKRVDLVLPYRTKGDAVAVPAWMCDALWSELGKNVPSRAGTRKLYLSRKNAPRRRMVNEADVTAPLKRMGFEIWRPDEMTFAEQQELLASAGVVVAEHGAALTNIVWCPADATVIEIHSTAPTSPCFKILAGLRGLRYIPIFSAESRRDEHEDWSIREDAIGRVLDAVREIRDVTARRRAFARAGR